MTDLTHLTDLSARLREHFGFSGFRPGQADALEALLSGQHTLVVMPTGAGKSLIYQLLSLQSDGLTLVISPLIALMKDQVDNLGRRGIPAAFINSTLQVSEQNQRLEMLAQGRYCILYVAPERLRSLAFQEALLRQTVSLLAVDEAHCISEWGHDFRPDYLHIASFRSALGNPLTAALTATATPKVQDDIVRLLGLPTAHRIVTGFNRPNLHFEVRYTVSPADKLHALRDLIASQNDGATLVYVGTRRDAEEVAEFARQVVEVPAEHYHAGLETENRTRIQEAFLSGKLPVVAATNAFGMGIDRPDVRQVLHYSMPGTLEAYYQEAGRAGRDGLPARAALLYAPDDRTLQEYFIENSVTTAVEMRTLYEILRKMGSRQVAVTTDHFSRLTGLPEIKVRVGLAELERAGAIEHLGDEGMRMFLRCAEWNDQLITASAANVLERQRQKKARLEQMIAYAETNTCRRRILLAHFGDQGVAEVLDCCDNCGVQQSPATPAGDPSQMPQSQRVALILLDTVRRLSTKVGFTKLTQILKGSQASAIKKFHYDRHVYYGRLEVFTQREIEEMIQQLLQMGHFKVIGGEYPVISLTPLGEAAIRTKAAIPLRLPRKVSSEQIARKKAERKAGGTAEYTAQLFAEGLQPSEIAQRRGLTISTIYTHLSRLIADGVIEVEAVVPSDERALVESVIRQVGSTEALSSLKALLPETIEYGVIRCVVAAWKGAYEPAEQRNASTDEVASFLARPHPRPLSGPWQTGWSLGFHSSFAGAEWNRSPVGELAYRLKYQGDLAVLPELVEQAASVINDHPELAQVDALVPTPPSTPRPNDPVSVFIDALAERLGLKVLPVVVKTRQTDPQKTFHTLIQKRANVAGAFAVQGYVKGKRLLVVDDLYDSGATLEEIHHVLRRAGAAVVNVLTLTRTIHSDA